MSRIKRYDPVSKTWKYADIAADGNLADEIESLKTTKADKTEVDKKANADDVYTKTAADNLLENKADQSTTYTKTEVDTALTAKEAKHTILSATLVTGETSLTLTSTAITDSSLISIYTDTWGVMPTAVTQTGGSVTLTFDAQSADLAVKVEVA